MAGGTNSNAIHFPSETTTSKFGSTTFNSMHTEAIQNGTHARMHVDYDFKILGFI